MKLLEATGQHLASGLHPSLPDSEIPFWKDGDNVVFESRSVRPGRGQFVLFPLLEAGRITGIYERDQDEFRYAYWGTGATLWQNYQPFPTAPMPNQDLSRAVGGDYAGTNDDLWWFETFGRFVLGTNGVDQIQLLQPNGSVGVANTALFEDMTTAGADLAASFRAQIVRTLGPFVLAINTDNSDQEVRWCHEDDLLVWTPETDNFARDIQVRDIISSINAAVDMGDGIVLYGLDQAHYLRFVGPPFFFASSHLLTGIGAFGKHSVIAVGRRHFGFGPKGIFVTDGTTFEYIDTPAIHDDIYGSTIFDTDRAKQVVAWNAANEDTVYWSFPTIGTELGLIVGFNYRLNVWTKTSSYRSAAASTSVFGSPILGDVAGNVLSQADRSQGSIGDPMLLTAAKSVFAGYGHFGYGGGGRVGYGGDLGILGG